MLTASPQSPLPQASPSLLQCPHAEQFPNQEHLGLEKHNQAGNHLFFEDFICHVRPFPTSAHPIKATQQLGAMAQQPRQLAEHACPGPEHREAPWVPSTQPGTAEGGRATSHSLAVCLKSTKHYCICSPLSFKYLLKFFLFFV